MEHPHCCTLAFATLLAASAAANAAAQSSLPITGQVVLTTGDVAPTVGANMDTSFDSPVMDLNGTIAFRAAMAGFTPADERAYFIGRARGDLQLLARSGDPEPSGTLPGVTLTGASGASNGLGSNLRIAPLGGNVMFGAGLFGTGVSNTGANRDDSALFYGQPGALQILVRRGDTAPGGATITSTYNSLSHQATGLNANGEAVFRVDLTGGDVNGTTNDDGWMIGSPGNLQFLAREGDPLPGGVVIGSLGFNCLINSVGFAIHDETLSTTLGATPATTADDKVICGYLGAPPSVILQREGDPVPGLVNVNYSGSPTLGSAFTTNSQFAFTSRLAGAGVAGTADDSAVFLGSIAGNMTMVAREGDPAPGIPGESLGVIFTSGITCNSAGTVVFINNLAASANVTSANDSCIVAASTSGSQIIVREGDPAPGFPTGFVIAAGGIVAGTSSPLLNERGQIVFQTTVTDTVNVVDIRGVQYAFEPGRGLSRLLANGDTITAAGGAQVVDGSSNIRSESSDGAPLGLNNNGDIAFIVRLSGNGSIVRGHLGGLVGTPSSLPVATGGTHTMELDAGPANAGRLYLLGGTTSGTRPGFSPLPGVQIPLNLDVWVDLSLAVINPLYPANIGSLDAFGRATTTMAVPGGFPAFQGITFHHAFGVLDTAGNVTYVSEPATVLLY